jgi:hypothetical protein
MLVAAAVRVDAGGRRLGGERRDAAFHGFPTRRSLLGGVVLGGTLLAVAGCADPSAPAEPPDAELATLHTAIATEAALIQVYDAARKAQPGLARRLRGPLHHHQSHLARLNSRIADASPSASASPSPSASASTAKPRLPRGGAAVLRALRAAERAASDERTRQLARVSPSLAQLLASIAACEYGHVAALSD